MCNEETEFEILETLVLDGEEYARFEIADQKYWTHYRSVSVAGWSLACRG